MKAVEKSRNTGLVNIQEVCSCLRLNRDAYYKSKERWETRKSVEAKVISLVKEERETQLWVGTLKLLKHFASDFHKPKRVNHSAISVKEHQSVKVNL
jgi:hypothetical protein